MFSTGVAKPDISSAGTPTAKAPRMACCWVVLTAEIIKPMPTTDRMNSSRPNESVRSTPALIMSNPSRLPIARAGSDFEIMISVVELEDTSS